MKMFKCLFLFLLIVSTTFNIKSDASSCSNDCACVSLCEQECAVLKNSGNIFGKTTYVPRSQGSNLARQMMGVEEKIHKFGNECFYGVASLAFEYQQIFGSTTGNRDSRNLGAWFSSTGNKTMTYGRNDNSGSNPNNFDLNALNWGYTGSGQIQFCPKKSDIIFDLNLYLGLDNWYCGLWARLDLPIVRTDFNINLINKPQGDPSSVLEADLYGTSAAFDPVYNSFKDALKGDEKVGTLPALNYAKICGSRTKTSLANMRITLGYDWFRRECWHFASAWLFVLPIGTRPTGEYVFEPVVGNYRRFELGTELNFAYELWHNCDSSHTFTFFADGYLNWVVPTRNKRTLSIIPQNAKLDQSTWSQYLLLKKYNSSNTVVGQERVANITTGDLKIGASVEGAGALLFQWNCNCMMSGIGYEIWGRAHEHAKSRCFEIKANTYALQGVSQWNGTVTNGAAEDNNQNAPTSTISTPGTISTAFSTGSYLTNDDLDICSALHPAAISNKIWGFVGYNWNNCDWQPFVLIGGEAEFGTDNAALSQWGIVGKGGLSF
jgi:hypothetical protein